MLLLLPLNPRLVLRQKKTQIEEIKMKKDKTVGSILYIVGCMLSIVQYMLSIYEVIYFILVKL